MKLLFAFSLSLAFHGLIAQQSDMVADEEKQSNYNYFIQNPLQINKVTADELSALGILTLTQIANFIAHRNQVHSFESIFELQTIIGWDLALLKKIKPFLHCDKTNKKWYNFSGSKHQLIIRNETTLEEKRGFSPKDARSKTRYLGNPWAHLSRYRGQINNNLRIGAILQKDAGEVNYLDFKSIFIEIKPNRWIDKIIVGDFINQWGQGLVQSGGFSLGKSFESIKATQKFHLGAIPYTSSGETSFYRGLNVQFHVGSFNFQAYSSFRNLDASLSSDSTGSSSKINSWIEDGYHRTTTELSHQSNVKERAWGGSLQWIHKISHLAIQLNLSRTLFSLEKSKSALAYKEHSWSGNQVQNYSISFQAPIETIHFTGELAWMPENNLSLIQGGAFALSKKTDLSYLCRYYSKSYFSPKAKGIGESAETTNEMGLFIGNQISFNKRNKLSNYLDFFKFPGLKYEVSQPNSWGWELLSRYQWEKRGKYTFFGQLKWTSKQNDISRSNTKLTRNHLIQTSLDLHQFRAKKLDLHTRIMTCLQIGANTRETGLLILQDVKYQMRSLGIQLRIGFISSSSYDSRLYAYEVGVPLSFSLPAYYGHGFRNCLVMDYKWTKNSTFSLKIGKTNYLDRDEIGSGLDLINGSHKTDVTFQCQLII
jgi:hypothetical protein